jgi:hypothetical protein
MDDRPYVFASDDYGQTWRAIVSGLPMSPVRRIAEDPRDGRVLVVGHERGVHFTNDGGTTWKSLNTNLPTVPVTNVLYQARDDALVVGTYGRGIYILDDAAPLRALTEDGAKNDALLVSTTRGRQWQIFASSPMYGVGGYAAANPEFDATITYYVRDGGSGTATIAISDAQGNAVRTLQGPVARGLNRVTWDMRAASAFADGVVAAGGRGGGRGGGVNAAAGPLVAPGQYNVSIRVPGIARALTGRLAVESDPMERMTAADRRARQAAATQVHQLQRSLGSARSGVVALLEQSDAIKTDLSRGGSAADSLLASAAVVRGEVDRLIGISTSLLRAVESFGTAPTGDQRRQMEWATDDAIRAIRTLNRVSQTDLPALYARHASGTRARTVPSVAVPPAAQRTP